MRRALAVGLAALALCGAPSAARACTIAIHNETIGGPDEYGISAREKRRREAALPVSLARDNRAETRRWRAEAERGLADGAEAHASALVATMVPEPVQISPGMCGSGPSIWSPYGDYREARAAVVAAAGEQGRYPLDHFAAGYAGQVRGCGEEMRGRLAGYVAARVDPAKLARIWYEVHRLGFDRSEVPGWQPLYFQREGSVLDLTQANMEATGHGESASDHRLENEADARLNADHWGRLRRFLAEDEEVQELVVVLRSGMAELGDEALPFGGLCPETTRGLDAFVAAAIDSATPPRPTVTVLTEPEPAGS